MSRILCSMMVFVFSFFFLGAQIQPVSAAETTMKEKAHDTKITTSVKSHLATEDSLKTLTQIDVKTIDGTVYLNGVAPTMEAKNRAEDITRKVEGVKNVVNDIRIDTKK